MRDKVAKILAESKANPEASGVTRSENEGRERIRELRKASGNLMTVAGSLATDNNGLNMRIMLAASAETWSEHKSVAYAKRT